MKNRERSWEVQSPVRVAQTGQDRLTASGFEGYCRSVKNPFRLSICALVLVCASLFFAGCSKETPGPKESFEAFVMDLWRGERASAFEAVWPEDRQRLMASSEELRQKLPELPPMEAEEWLVVGRVDNPYDIRRLEVVSGASASYERGDRVTVEIQYFDDRKGQVEMVWGGDRWYVALSESAADVEPPRDVVDATGNEDADDEALQLLDQDVSTDND